MSKRYALVLGASSDLGVEIVGSLLDRDYIVFGAGRRGLELDHEDYLDFEVDLSYETSVFNFFSEIREETTKLDLVVNALGAFYSNEIGRTTSEEFGVVLDINVLSTFHLFKHLEEFVSFHESHIISILSVAAKRYYSYMSASCSSEAARLSLIESLKKEWRDKKIRFTNFLLGPINTSLWDTVEGIDTSKMLDVDEFMYVFDTVIDASPVINFNTITLTHAEEE